MTKIYFILIFLLIFFSGCTIQSPSSQSCQSVLSHHFQPTGITKKFDLPSDVLCYAFNLQVYTDKEGNENLYFLGRENKLLIYNISNEELSNSIVLQERGPNGVGKANGFFVLSPDSILVTSKYVQKFNFVDGAGQKVFSYNYRDDELVTSSTISNYLTPFFFDASSNIYMPQCIEGNWTQLPLSAFQQYRTTLSVNVKTNIKNKVGLAIPYNKSELKKKSFNYSATQAGKLFIFSFDGSDSIYVTKDFLNYQGLLCKSTHVFGDLACYLGTDDVQKLMKSKIESCYYTSVAWDPYREVIYRFYKLGETDLKESDDLFSLNHYPAKFGIMAINKNMEIVADQVFESNKYFFGNYYISKEGLFLSINHPSNPEMDYNKLTFELIKLEKN